MFLRVCFVDSEISRCGGDNARLDRVIYLGHFGAVRFYGLVFASLGCTAAIRRFECDGFGLERV